MPDDRFPMNSADAEHDLVAALRTLPLQAPKRSVFADLERSLSGASTSVSITPSPRRQRGAWIALAATLLAAIAGARLFQPQTIDTVAMEASPSSDTLALIAQSQQLDDMLAMLDARSVPIDSESAMASAELEDLIGLTDLQLNATRRDDEAQALWSRRVALMSRLAVARAGPSFNALSDNAGASLLDARYRID